MAALVKRRRRRNPNTTKRRSHRRKSGEWRSRKLEMLVHKIFSSRALRLFHFPRLAVSMAFFSTAFLPLSCRFYCPIRSRCTLSSSAVARPSGIVLLTICYDLTRTNNPCVNCHLSVPPTTTLCTVSSTIHCEQLIDASSKQNDVPRMKVKT